MPLTRRQLLRTAGLIPVGLAATVLVARAGDALRAAAAGIRPAPAGTSATRCALCGSGDHTMLDVRCPAARKVI